MTTPAGAPVTKDSELSLAKAVTRLTEVVEGLQTMIREDYPKRAEIEETFVTKYGIKKRRRQYSILVVCAIVASYFWTMGTVSYCFLSGNSDGSTTLKPYCTIVPGYRDAVARNQRLVGVFGKLVETTQTNDQRLDKLEQQQSQP